MTKIRTLVVDDEPIARARVVSLLQEEADIEVIGECANGQQAMSAIESSSPDLLFLDIQMPEVNGLDLARTIQSTGTPAVVFVTAYDEYALQGVRSPRARFPAEAVQRRAFPVGARPRARTGLTAPERCDDAEAADARAARRTCRID